MNGPVWKTLWPALLFLLALILISAQVQAGRRGSGPLQASSLTDTVPLEAMGPLSRLLNRGADLAEDLWQNYFYLVSLKQENVQLRRTIERLHRQTVELEEHRQANKHLAALLDLAERAPDEFLAGR
ncbi:MAG: hypothetical protein LBK52_06045, partial [Deltaproteobacteria bacterium]|nr:hypothetical protein [Deltaproteobacteria bacterium]